MRASSKPFRILSIDGGGIRGVYPITILARLADELGGSLLDHFDLMVGTSTGAVIVAGLAIGKSPAEILDLYVHDGPGVFTLRQRSGYGSLKSYYDTSHARDILRAFLGPATLAEARLPVAFPAINVATAEGRLFTSWDQPEQTLADVVTASAAAPYYFDPEPIDGQLFVDGGLWANNPSLAAYASAIGDLKVAPKRVRLLSLGTGYRKQYFSADERQGKSWGLIHWHPTQFIKMLVESQAFGAEDLLRKLLPATQCLRVNFVDEQLPPIDAYQKIDAFRERGEQSFDEHRGEILRLLSA